MSAAAPATTETAHPVAGDLSHLVECHDDNRSLCGLDMTHVPWGPIPGEQDCIVCSDLESLPCGCECGCCDEVDE